MILQILKMLLGIAAFFGAVCLLVYLVLYIVTRTCFEKSTWAVDDEGNTHYYKVNPDGSRGEEIL